MPFNNLNFNSVNCTVNK